MTDRYSAFLVVLDHDVREDDAEAGVLIALRHVKGVINVQPVPSDSSIAIATSRVRSEMQTALLKVVLP